MIAFFLFHQIALNVTAEKSVDKYIMCNRFRKRRKIILKEKDKKESTIDACRVA